MVLPLILSLLIEQVIGLTDVIFLGRVGEIELGASALAGVMYLSVVMFGFGYCFSLQAFMGQKNGEKDYLSMGEALHSGTLFLMLFSVILMAVAFMGSTPFLARVVESPEIAVATEKYFFWRAVGIPFTFLAAVARGFFIATLNPRIITVSSIVMMLSNIVLDYVLILAMEASPPWASVVLPLPPPLPKSWAFSCSLFMQCVAPTQSAINSGIVHVELGHAKATL